MNSRRCATGLVNNLINYLQGQPYGSVYQLIAALTKLQPANSQAQAPALRMKAEAKKAS